jgi:hypothetical protein
VDYYTFGSCRLVDGSYYCGTFSTAAPYKGLANSEDNPHIGSDQRSFVTSSQNFVHTGTRVWSANNPNELKLQKAANPDFYTPENAGALGPAYRSNPVNNGMWTGARTATGTAQPQAGGIGTFTTPEPSWESQRSNYAMQRKKEYGGGPHHVNF